MNFKRAYVALCCVLSGAFAVPAATFAANPLGFAYNGSLTNVPLYGKSTGMLITGRCNRYAAAFATARSKGAEILAYLDPAERPDRPVCALDTTFYMNNIGSVPLWPYPSYGQRQQWGGTKLTDMRPGSKWILYVVSYVSNLMRERKVDGVFLDVTGARVWGAANWNGWPQAEKNLWTDGNIDLVRRLDAARKAINPDFIIVNNNVWDRGDTRGLAGEQYVAGVAIEHPALGVPAWHKAYASKAFGNVGHRRVLVIARDATDAKKWSSTVPGVTHVSSQTYYGYPTVPPVPFKALTDR